MENSNFFLVFMDTDEMVPVSCEFQVGDIVYNEKEDKDYEVKERWFNIDQNVWQFACDEISDEKRRENCNKLWVVEIEEIHDGFFEANLQHSEIEGNGFSVAEALSDLSKNMNEVVNKV